MPTEAEKRLHRCCFSAQDPEKLKTPEEEVDAWFARQIDAAAADGYSTFLCGCDRGADLAAGLTVLRKTEKSEAVRLICVPPWPEFAEKWVFTWESRSRWLRNHADYVKYISPVFHDRVYEERDKYLVNHSRRLIAWYEDGVSRTWDMIEYAVRQGIEVVTNRPEYVEEFRAELEKEKNRRR